MLRIINEPTAAAMAYGLHNQEGVSDIIVVDMGGGTLDVSLLNVQGGMFQTMAMAGRKLLSYISMWFPCLWLVKRPHVTTLSKKKWPCSNFLPGSRRDLGDISPGSRKGNGNWENNGKHMCGKPGKKSPHYLKSPNKALPADRFSC